jgi:hypothetical protein
VTLDRIRATLTDLVHVLEAIHEELVRVAEALEGSKKDKDK